MPFPKQNLFDLWSKANAFPHHLIFNYERFQSFQSFYKSKPAVAIWVEDGPESKGAKNWMTSVQKSWQKFQQMSMCLREAVKNVLADFVR